jgi:beta-lactamase superfamily II metal-dependent hydrolase
MKAEDKQISIKMYDVGFGDSFFLKIPTNEGMKTILFDCGSWKQADGKKYMDKAVPQIIEDCTDGKARIDIVVCSHRHSDHVYGFERSEWSDVEVGEVWMPWTEEDNNPKAKKLKDRHEEMAMKLISAFRLQMKMEGADKDRINAFYEMAVNAFKNEKAMDMLYGGFKGKPKHRYLSLKEDDKPDVFMTDILPGIRINVLGPTLNTKVFGSLKPETGESYLNIYSSPEENGKQTPEPFSDNWVIPDNEIEEYSKLDEKIKKQIDDIAEMENFGSELAIKVLDNEMNNSSLILMLEVGDQFLLFPGDAQWGPWEIALNNPSMRSLLEKTTFYKVGHHGSHNATPKSFVEKLLQGQPYAMVSTKPGVHNAVPKTGLMNALKAKTNLARSDKKKDLLSEFHHIPGDFCDSIELKLPL